MQVQLKTYPKNLEKIRDLLSHRKDEMGFECSTERKLAQKECKRKQARSKGIKKQSPVYRDQIEYLYQIGAIDCIKKYKEWKTSLRLIQKQKETKKRSKPKRASNIAKSIDEKQGTIVDTANEDSTTKLEHKQY